MDFRNHFDEVEDGKLKYENSDNIIIYGHNMADESMFGKLKYYYGSEQYYMDHPVIQLNSNYETYKYKIFAVFIVDVEDKTETQYECWNCTELNSEEEFYDFVNNAKRRTIYTNDVDVKYGDGLLTLSTCHYLLKDRSRLIIMARTVRPGEDEYKGTEKSERNSNIQWPSMYYNTKRNEKYDKDAIFIPYGPEEAVKEAEAKLAAQKKKEQEAKKKEEQASKDAEKAKNTTTTKKSGSKTTTKSNKTTAKTTKTTAKTTKTTAKTTKTTAAKTAS
jgi:sortase B